jgi:hypothetical protein
MDTIDHGLSRRMWHQLEPVHAIFYYAPDVFAEAAVLGYAVDTRWPSYFAWRSAPLGAAGPGQVAAVCYSFSPRMVAEHVPAAFGGVAVGANPAPGPCQPGRAELVGQQRPPHLVDRAHPGR